MKPDWDKLMDDFKGNPSSLVGDVDCTAGGKGLCEKVKVEGYPTLKYGDPNELKDYSGGRDYDALKAFADENLGPSCGPSTLDLCNDAEKAIIDAFMKMDEAQINKAIKEVDDQVAKLTDKGTKAVAKLQKTIAGLEKGIAEENKKKEDLLKQETKKLGLGMMKKVHSSKKKKDASEAQERWQKKKDKKEEKVKKVEEAPAGRTGKGDKAEKRTVPWHEFNRVGAVQEMEWVPNPAYAQDSETRLAKSLKMLKQRLADPLSPISPKDGVEVPWTVWNRDEMKKYTPQAVTEAEWVPNPAYSQDKNTLLRKSLQLIREGEQEDPARRALRRIPGAPISATRVEKPWHMLNREEALRRVLTAPVYAKRVYPGQDEDEEAEGEEEVADAPKVSGLDCGPKNLDSCSDEDQALIEKFQAMSKEDLKAAMAEVEERTAKIEAKSQKAVNKLQGKVDDLHKQIGDEYDKKANFVKAESKKMGLGIMQKVHSGRKKQEQAELQRKKSKKAEAKPEVKKAEAPKPSGRKGKGKTAAAPAAPAAAGSDYDPDFEEF